MVYCIVCYLSDWLEYQFTLVVALIMIFVLIGFYLECRSLIVTSFPGTFHWFGSGAEKVPGNEVALIGYSTHYDSHLGGSVRLV